MDRYIVSIVDPQNRVRSQTTPGVAKADVPDVISKALDGGGGVDPLQPGWVITVCQEEASVALQLTPQEREIYRRAAGARN